MQNQAQFYAPMQQANLGYTSGQIPAWQMGIQLPLQQANLGYTAGQIPQWQQQIQSLQSPWNLASMYSGTYGSPIVQPGQTGLLQSLAPFAAIAGGSAALQGTGMSGFGSNLMGMFGV
jgi:hypothetical protein